MTQNIKSARVTGDKGSLLRTLIDSEVPVRYMLKCGACDNEFYEVEVGQVIFGLPECCETPHIIMAPISQSPANGEQK